jgi:tRNA G10  N-methylase Trm11
MKYFFTLGNHPALSADEIRSRLKLQNIEFTEIAQVQDFFVVELSTEIDVKHLIEMLGGTIKIGKIVGNVQSVKDVENEALGLIPHKDTKVNFGISTHNASINALQFGKSLKRELKQKEVKARFVQSKVNPLSSVIVQTNKLLTTGIEIVIMKTDTEFLLGQTLVVQPFETYGKLDFGRPSRDPQSGMLPPKLAQIMLNLAEVAPESAIYDPFCGSGTILQQSLLQGQSKLIGSDSSRKAVQDTHDNLSWLSEETGKSYNYDVFTHEITEPNERVKPSSMQAIVTEPFLGPPLRGHEPTAKMDKIISELTLLYTAAFKQLEKALQPNGVMIIIIPEFKTEHGTRKIQLNLPSNLEIEKTWQYSRPKQHLIRNIVKIRKQIIN